MYQTDLNCSTWLKWVLRLPTLPPAGPFHAWLGPWNWLSWWSPNLLPLGNCMHVPSHFYMNTWTSWLLLRSSSGGGGSISEARDHFSKSSRKSKLSGASSAWLERASQMSSFSSDLLSGIPIYVQAVPEAAAVLMFLTHIKKKSSIALGLTANGSRLWKPANIKQWLSWYSSVYSWQIQHWAHYSSYFSFCKPLCNWSPP